MHNIVGENQKWQTNGHMGYIAPTACRQGAPQRFSLKYFFFVKLFHLYVVV